MTEQELQKRIESSPALQRARENLLSEVSFRAGSSARFDPFTILMIISVIIQILSYCRKRRHPDEVAADIRNVRALPKLRTRRLRQRLKHLWEEHCANPEECRDNAFLAAAMELGEKATDEEIAELMALAEAQ